MQHMFPLYGGPRMDDQESQKEAVKAALKEWLDEKFTLLGKWSAGAFAAALIAAIAYFILWSQGWHKP